MTIVLFACIHNAGRSQMAAAFFERLADPTKALAISAGTQPAAHVHPEVVASMREAGIDLAAVKPRGFATVPSHFVDVLVTMGCGDKCPTSRAVWHEDWQIPDPKHMAPEQFRAVRDLIETKVKELLASLKG